MNSDENEEDDGYLHNEDGSREMCTHCCEWLLDDGSCPDPDCERNCDDENESDESIDAAMTKNKS